MVQPWNELHQPFKGKESLDGVELTDPPGSPWPKWPAFFIGVGFRVSPLFLSKGLSSSKRNQH